MQLLAILIYSVLLGTFVSTAGAAGVNSTCRQDPRARSDFCGARSADSLHMFMQCMHVSACRVEVRDAPFDIAISRHTHHEEALADGLSFVL